MEMSHSFEPGGFYMVDGSLLLVIFSLCYWNDSLFHIDNDAKSDTVDQNCPLSLVQLGKDVTFIFSLNDSSPRTVPRLQGQLELFHI